MQVETYEVEEINSSEAATMAADAEAMELIEKLGLSGQKALSNPETCTRQPYRLLTTLETNTCSVLFPEHTRLENYAQGPIPLRVLQVAAHAKETGLFKHLEVWHPANPYDKDPVLIGIATDPRPHWDWNSVPFLLARWGDALQSWDELAEKARKIWIVRMEAKLKALQLKAGNDLARLEAIAAEGFSGGELEQLTYSAS